MFRFMTSQKNNKYLSIMIKRRRILHADKIIQNVVHVFCLLMFLQLKGFYSYTNNPILLYATTKDIRITSIESIEFNKAVKGGIIVKDLEQGAALDFLYRKDMVCWSEQTAELIQCTHYNGTHTGEKMRIVSDGLISPVGIAIDWYTEKIYWTDGETNKIEVISLENSYRKVLFWTEVDLARAIAVVPMHGLMFWTDWGETPKIERAGMDGDPASRKVIVKDKICWPNGISVDYTNNLIYWVDAKLKFIDVMDFNGDNRTRIVEGGFQYPYALTYFNNRFFWTDWETWNIHVFDMHLSKGMIMNLIKTNSSIVPMDIRVLDASRQITPEHYPCKEDNGGCSHLCLLSPDPPGYKCACPTGVKLVPGSNTTCLPAPQALLVVAQRSTISKISLDSPDYTPYRLPLKDVKRALAVDYDPNSEFIYWADNIAKSISRARLDGSEQSTVIHTEAGLDSIAIDPLAQNIYWTDPVADTITVARLNGSNKKVIIYTDLYDPRAIALHPTAGLMFWSDWNVKKPKIERANLDGSDRILLVFERLIWPNGIAVDTNNNKIYWGDARMRKIEVCNLDGSDRRELQNSDIVHIYGLTLLGDHLYWSDMQGRTLERIDRITGMDRQLLIEQMANMMGIKAIQMGEPMGSNPCAANNGNCTHLCFNKPNEYVCSCPLGLELDNDMHTCIEPEAFLVYSRKDIIGLASMESRQYNAVLPLKDIKEVGALAVHASGQQIYWSDSKTKTINRCSINAFNMEKIIEATGVVEGLAVDWCAQSVYWTDAAAARIEVARLDGSSRRALLWQGLKKPKSIVLDPPRGYMYWSELGSRSIRRAGMDGTGAAPLVEGAGRVHALALDPRTLYWAALDPPALASVRLDGAARRDLLPAALALMPVTLAVHRDRLYWGDWTAGDIETAMKADGSGRRIVHRGLDFMSDLKVLTRRDPSSNQCSVDNGGCQHLCLAIPAATSSYRCGCPTHYRLNSDNYTCSPPEEFLLYAQKNSIGRIMVAAGECNDATVPITGLKNVKAIEYDPVHGTLYWMDEDSHSIRRVAISYAATSVSESSVVVKDLSRPFHMVLDVLGRALYWSCLDVDSINVTLVDTNSSVLVVVKGENMMPRHLALYQSKRLLIWNDVGLGAIMCANVDGSGVTRLAVTHNASALAVDQGAGVVYWAVARQIQAVDIHGQGGDARVVWKGGWAGSLGGYQGGLYWAAGGGGALMRLALTRRDAPAQTVPHVARVVAVLAVNRVARSHPCYNGGACTRAAGACLAEGECACGAGCAPPPNCPPRHYRCLSTTTHQCILDNWRCDGHPDCADGSDEGASCGACGGALRCADGACASALADCRAGVLCAKPLPDAFRCDDRLCLAPRLLCDGHAHCADASDEAPDLCPNPHKDQAHADVAGGGSVGGGVSRALVWCGAALGAAAAAALVVGGARRCGRPPRASPAAGPVLAPAAIAAKHRDRRHTPLGESATDCSLSERLSLCSWTGYPRPTLNPPPSPATASSARPPRPPRRAYRHYRSINRPPPPTPASTDAADSDFAPRPPPPSPTHS